MKTSQEVDKALENAGKIANKYGHVYISTEHMLLAMFLNKEFAKMLTEFGVQLNELKLDLESHIADTFHSAQGKSQIKTQAKHQSKQQHLRPETTDHKLCLIQVLN